MAWGRRGKDDGKKTLAALTSQLPLWDAESKAKIRKNPKISSSRSVSVSADKAGRGEGC
jgi:hypothetical protein